MMNRVIRTTLLLAACTMALPVDAREIGTGRLPIKFDPPAPAAFAADEELRLTGTVESDVPLILVLRVDDGKSFSYATRYNEERTLPPGPFRWTVPAGGMMTAVGRVLDHNDIRRVHLFVGKGEGKVIGGQVSLDPAPRLPGRAKGYSLGALNAPLAPGFERIAPGNPMIEAGKAIAIRRPQPDPLVANGIRGVERLRLPWQPGRARVTLWTEDPGEWELLPHPLNRRLRINGIDVLQTRLTALQWLDQRYFRGATAEHAANDDAWSAYGRHRGETVTAEIDVGDAGIVIELAGEGAQALFLSAVLIEPAGDTIARDVVEAERTDWYRRMWPLATAQPAPMPTAEVQLSGTVPPPVSTMQVSAAPGTGVRLRLAVTSDITIAKPTVRLEPPSFDSKQIDAKIWAGHYRLERRKANDTILTRGDNMLAGVPEVLPLRANERRHYELWATIPADASPGLYRGALIVGSPDAPVSVPVEIDVLPITLPPVTKSAGYYLDEPAYANWFRLDGNVRATVLSCDLNLMRHLGLTGSAPALATPTAKSNEAFDADMRRAMDAGVAPGWLGYTPAKRLRGNIGVEASAEKIGHIEQVMRDAGQVPPLWSVADEPSNPGHAPELLDKWIAAIRTHAPKAQLAAQLNTPADLALANKFDVAVVNDGFGLDPETIIAAKSRSRANEAWIYNSSEPRLTAGFWLWKTAASRYLQWHARMPTADPFDPTDGREGDVQMVFPSRDACPANPTIHRDLLDMAEGVVDQRWLLWLEMQQDKAAVDLLASIRSLALTWKVARSLSAGDLQRMRESIMVLAKRRH
jgi:hypothetical protein